MVVWQFVAETIPLYPLYVLMFLDAGLSEARVSALLAIWSVAGILAEVPAGVIADRWSRRRAMVVSGLLQGLGYVVWIVAPGFGGFAGGFVLWAVGGAFASGSQEALLHDGLAAEGKAHRYAQVQGWVTAADFAAFVPAVVGATVLLPLGGYQLVAWVSVGTSLVAAALAARLPEVRPANEADDGGATMRTGLREAVSPGVLGVVVALGLFGGFDAIDEYFGLLVVGWGVPQGLAPLAVLVVVLVGGAGAACAGLASGWSPRAVAGAAAGALALLAVAGTLARPAAVIVLALSYGVYRVVLVVLDARLQARITGPTRATTTSVAAFGVELVGLTLFALWAVGQLGLVVAVWGVAAFALVPLLASSRSEEGRRDERSNEAGLERRG